MTVCINIPNAFGTVRGAFLAAFEYFIVLNILKLEAVNYRVQISTWE